MKEIDGNRGSFISSIRREHYKRICPLVDCGNTSNLVVATRRT